MATLPMQRKQIDGNAPLAGAADPGTPDVNPEADRIRSAAFEAFHRWMIQDYQELLPLLEAGGPEAPKRYRDAYLQGQFLMRRTQDLGFQQRVAGALFRSSKLMRHRRLLIRAAILTIIHAEGVSVEQILEPPQDRSEEPKKNAGYSRRQMQRLVRSRFGEYFPAASRAERTRRGDAREAGIKTVFTPRDLPRTDGTELAERHFAREKLEAMADPDTMDELKIRAMLRPLDPLEFEALDRFIGVAQVVLDEIRPEGKTQTTRRDYLSSQLRIHTPLSEVMHNQTESILAVYWFRSHTFEGRVKILRAPFLYSVRPEGVRRYAQILEGAGATIKTQRGALYNLAALAPRVEAADASIAIYRYLIEGATRDSERANLTGNLASTLKMKGRYAAAVAQYQKANRILVKKGGSYESLVNDKNIAECRLRMGHRRVGLEALARIAQIVPTFEPASSRFSLWKNLGYACLRAREWRQALAYLANAMDQPASDEQLLEVSQALTWARWADETHPTEHPFPELEGSGLRLGWIPPDLPPHPSSPDEEASR